MGLTFPELVKAALEIGVIPAVALFLIVALYLQNRQLMRERRETEVQLLKTLARVIKNYDSLLEKVQQGSGSEMDIRRITDAGKDTSL